jgi:squalene-associated FAD-dependent desaturase
MVGPDGGRSRLVCPDWQPPWHLVAGVLRWRALPLADRLTALKLRSVLEEVRRDGAEAVAARVPAGQTVSEWLTAQGQSARLTQWLWAPLAIAALNQSPDDAAARPFVRVLGELFGPRVEDAAIGMSSVPLDELYAEPAQQIVRSAGGAVLRKSPARIHVSPSDRIERVSAGAEQIETGTVISAVPWHALGRIWADQPPAPLRQVIAAAAAMDSLPIVTVNIWFDEAVMAEPFAGLVGGPMHWIFDKSAIFHERAGHLSIVASGAVRLASMDNVAIAAAVREQLARALPATARARVVRSVVVREHRATFSLAPGGPPRPPAKTGLDGCYLAGDWTDTGLPGTIEGAVLSGHRAADLVLRGEPGARQPRPS